ncbi:MAG TPA: hypothetical protein VN922_24765 [Bacteroidia bacterium]|nr:hypothetical protein [Bacteroidia bacterium]
MDEELKKAIDYFEYLPFRHMFEKKPMPAKERNQKLYEHLLTFTERGLYGDDLEKELKNTKSEDIKSLEDIENLNQSFNKANFLTQLWLLKYIETKKFPDKNGKINSVIEITELGWQFLERHETYLANKKLMEIQMVDYESKTRQANRSLLIAVIAVLVTIISFIWSVYTYHDESVKNGSLTKENYSLRDSLVFYKTLKFIAKDTQNKSDTALKK